MAWSEEVMSKLRAWLAPGTAYKQHPLDDARFYQFVAAVWREEQGLWDEARAREIIIREAKALHGEWADEMIAEFVQERRSQGSLILDFLEQTKGTRDGRLH